MHGAKAGVRPPRRSPLVYTYDTYIVHCMAVWLSRRERLATVVWMLLPREQRASQARSQALRTFPALSLRAPAKTHGGKRTDDAR